jgi:hypothetical protein
VEEQMTQERNPDPVIRAVERVQAAERAFLGLPIRNISDEFGEPAVIAQAQWEEAEQAFADCVPTSYRGAIVKLRAVADLCQGSGLDNDSLELRHLRALQVYIETLERSQLAATHGALIYR